MSKPSPRTDMEALAVARRNSGIGDEPAIAWAQKRIVLLEDALRRALKIIDSDYRDLTGLRPSAHPAVDQLRALLMENEIGDRRG